MASFSTRTHAQDGKEYAMRVKHGEKSGQELFQAIPDVEGITMHHWYSTPEKAVQIYGQVSKARTA